MFARVDAGIFTEGGETFGEDDDFVAGNGVFFDGFADDFFADAVAVDVG